MEDSKIYRFKFADPVVDEISKFAQLHRDDDRIVFKEAWNEWVVENQDLISDEKQRLTTLKYTGEIEDKMFKSARYYFRKGLSVKKAPKTDVCSTVDRRFFKTVIRYIENNRSN